MSIAFSLLLCLNLPIAERRRLFCRRLLPLPSAWICRIATTGRGRRIRGISFNTLFLSSLIQQTITTFISHNQPPFAFTVRTTLNLSLPNGQITGNSGKKHHKRPTFVYFTPLIYHGMHDQHSFLKKYVCVFMLLPVLYFICRHWSRGISFKCRLIWHRMTE